MKDFGIDTLFLTEIILCLIIYTAYQIRIRLLQRCKIAAKESLIPFKSKDISFYYSSYAVKQECIHDFFHLPQTEFTKLSLTATQAPQLCDIIPAIQEALQKNPHNISLLLLNAHILLLCNKPLLFRHIMENLQISSFAPRHLKAQYYFLKAHSEIYQTDMHSASAHLDKALRLYKKLGFMYEEAECYLLLSQLYRITGIFDVAETMLKEADKSFRQLKMTAKKAECMAYYGLISFGREQYDFAIQYLAGAAAIAKRGKLIRSYADINNWLGLAFYMNRKAGKAEKHFLIALKNAQTKECKAYATEMLSRVRYQNRDYKNALKYIETALSVSDFQVNPAGFLENLYIKAEILFARKEYLQSKKILTRIIRKKLPPSVPFYPANAYTLLGLIHLKENDLNKAKTLFKQAVDLEHGKNRLKGAAVDYNNLAEIARMEGNTKVAEIYLKQALTYAKNIEDKELQAYLKAKLG